MGANGSSNPTPIEADRNAVQSPLEAPSGWGQSPSISEPGLGFVSLTEVTALQGRLGLPVARSAAFVADDSQGAESSLNEGSHSPLPRQPWPAAEQPLSARSSG